MSGKCGLHKPIIAFMCLIPAAGPFPPMSCCCSVNSMPAHTITCIIDQSPWWRGTLGVITLVISTGCSGLYLMMSRLRTSVFTVLWLKLIWGLFYMWFHASVSFQHRTKVLIRHSSSYVGYFQWAGFCYSTHLENYQTGHGNPMSNSWRWGCWILSKMIFIKATVVRGVRPLS